ncbi:MAG: zinc ribbon domain-containing protein [Oscillospiraceae bacterium]|nr:zinc ribbon domain-containing protein [Oscillospiraceae bacterium]
MKFCTNCGCHLESEAAFCAQCGARVEGAEPQQAASVPPEAPQPSVQPAALVRKHASSPLFLTAIVLLTASIFMSFISVFMPSNSIMDIIDTVESVLIDEGSFSREEQGELVEMFAAAREFAVEFQGSVALQEFLSLLPSMLICLGLWLFFKSCNDRKNPGVRTTGLTIVKGVNIFYFVMILIVFALLIILSAIISAFISAEFGSDIVGAALVVTLIITSAIVLALLIPYYISMFRIINGARRLLRGEGPVKFGMFFPVLVFIFSGIGILSSLSFLAYDPLTGLQSMLSALPGFLMAIAYVRFRSEYNTLPK